MIISNYKIIFTKGYTPNWTEEVFSIKKVKTTVPWRYVTDDFNDKEITGTFDVIDLQKTNHSQFKIEKVIKKKIINSMLNGNIMIIHLIIFLNCIIHLVDM